MVRNILLQKVILLRRGFIAKLMLSNVWPTSMPFPNFLAFLVISVTELNFAPDNGRFYFLPTSVCDTKNNDLPIEDRYSGLICQHALANIINLSQRFIKSLHQPTKPHGLVDKFPNR